MFEPLVETGRVAHLGRVKINTRYGRVETTRIEMHGVSIRVQGVDFPIVTRKAKRLCRRSSDMYL
jgi:hypothetical protein